MSTSRNALAAVTIRAWSLLACLIELLPWLK